MTDFLRQMTDANGARPSRRRFLQIGAGLVVTSLLDRTIGWAEQLTPTVTERRTVWAMGGWNILEVEAPSGEAAREALSAAVEAVREVDRTFSVFDPRTPLALLNAAATNHIPLENQLLLKGLSESLTWAERTGGAFDPAIESLMAHWGFREGAPRHTGSVEPSGFRGVGLDSRCATLLRESAHLEIDPGAWAKGLAAERAVTAALRAGAMQAQANCGCDIYRSAGDAWNCFIRDPEGGPEEVVFSCRSRFRSAATSGNYESHRIAPDGRRIGHLMDPRTGQPAESDIESVTVFGHDGLAVDAVSSALFVMGTCDAVDWLTQHPDFAAVILTKGWRHDATQVCTVGRVRVGGVTHG